MLEGGKGNNKHDIDTYKTQDPAHNGSCILYISCDYYNLFAS